MKAHVVCLWLLHKKDKLKTEGHLVQLICHTTHPDGQVHFSTNHCGIIAIYTASLAGQGYEIHRAEPYFLVQSVYLHDYELISFSKEFSEGKIDN